MFGWKFCEREQYQVSDSLANRVPFRQTFIAPAMKLIASCILSIKVLKLPAKANQRN
jgi:hypothetical protein